MTTTNRNTNKATHKAARDSVTCALVCACGYYAKRRGFVVRHLEKHDPDGLDRLLGLADETYTDAQTAADREDAGMRPE